MKVTVTDDCVACGLCVESCPDVFDLADDIAEVKVDVVPAELEEAVREAAQDCPAESIIIEE